MTVFGKYIDLWVPVSVVANLGDVVLVRMFGALRTLRPRDVSALENIPAGEIVV